MRKVREQITKIYYLVRVIFLQPISLKTLMSDQIGVCLRCACILFFILLCYYYSMHVSHHLYKKTEFSNLLTMKVMILGDWVGQDAHTVFR
jgi:hypothetical protein